MPDNQNCFFQIVSSGSCQIKGWIWPAYSELNGAVLRSLTPFPVAEFPWQNSRGRALSGRLRCYEHAAALFNAPGQRMKFLHSCLMQSVSLSLSKLSAFRYRNPWQFNSISGYHSYYGRNLEVWNYNFNVNWYRFDFNHPISFWTLILFIYYFFLYFLIFSSIILTFLRSFYYFLFPIRFNFVVISSRFCKLFIIKLFAFKWLNNPSFLLVAIS